MKNLGTVKSLADYVRLIEKIPSSDYFYRGESDEYRERMASAFRPYSSSFSKEKKEYPFITMLDEFYRETAAQLHEFDRKNFIAYAQHHGIPTNLIDVTTSPLVALFFACTESKNDKCGLVYFYDKKYIDVTSILEDDPTGNIIDRIIENKNGEFEQFLCLIEGFETEYPQEFQRLFKALLKDFAYYFKHSLFKEINKVCAFARKKYDAIDMLQIILLLCDETEKNKGHLDFLGNHSDSALAYCMLFLEFFYTAKEVTEPIWWINFAPLCIYKPTLAFERANKQDGFFLYQSYLSYVESAYGAHILMTQRLSPRLKVAVENQEEIKKSLDGLGINRKTIYADHDNIARYILEKYSP